MADVYLGLAKQSILTNFPTKVSAPVNSGWSHTLFDNYHRYRSKFMLLRNVHASILR